VEKWEQCARLLDLFLVSVLLDAGAGNRWTYKEQGEDQNGGEGIYSRSEGLAIASLDMFCAGVFSSDANQPYRVDGTLIIDPHPAIPFYQTDYTESHTVTTFQRQHYAP
jgi:Protein of unknown function (DUF1688)